MQCNFALRMIDYTLDFDQPVFTLVQRQTDLLQACFQRCAHEFRLDLTNLQATGGSTYADVVVTVQLPALRGGVEVRGDRLIGFFKGLASEEEAARAILFVMRCKEAVDEVFPSVGVASARMSVNSWFLCDGDAQAVRSLLNVQQSVRFDPRSVGADSATFTVHGQVSNNEEAWQIGFALEPSALPDYQLFVACSATYKGRLRYLDPQQQEAHLSQVTKEIIGQFGFDEEHARC